MELYDNSSNSNDHLSMLSYKGAYASIVCHAFPLSLKSLLSKSINLWLDLRRKFRFAFATSKERLKTEVNLRLIQQEPEEPHRGYILRFNKESRDVDNLQLGVV